MYSELLNALKYWNDYEVVKERSLNNNFIENTYEDQVSTSYNDDISDSTLQFLPAWLNKNEVKPKRAYRKYHTTNNLHNYCNSRFTAK